MARAVLRTLALSGALAAGMAARAEAPAPFPDFAPKRVTVPGARSADRPQGPRRITVQIDPGEQAARLAALPPMPKASSASPALPLVPETGAYDWFWEKVSPSLDYVGPARLEQAMQALGGAGTIPAPRLQSLQEIAVARGVDILRATIGTSVSPALVLAVISVESAGRTAAVSPAGAAGLMQLMPDTATRFGVTDRMVASQSITGGVRYLDWLMGEFDGDPVMVLAGYNAGEGAVKRHQGVPPYRETRDYVPKVLAAFRVASGLCASPPELISDGCVFLGMN